MNRFVLTFFAALLLAPSLRAADTSWIGESNRNAQILLDIAARYNPEFAASLGVEGHDAEVFDLKPGVSERTEADLEAAAVRLEALRADTSDSRVRQDLDILINAARSQRQTSMLNRKYLLPFFDLPQAVYSGFQNLLESRVPKDRQKAAVIRLRRYAGTEKGYEPVTTLMRAQYEKRAGDSALLGPWVVEAQQYLDNQTRYLDGIEKLLQESGLKGWQKDLQTLRRQFDEYGAWVRSTVLPRARKGSQLPAELYADNLKTFGVQMDPHELMDRALANYVQTRDELEPRPATTGRQHRRSRGVRVAAWQSQCHRGRRNG